VGTLNPQRRGNSLLLLLLNLGEFVPGRLTVFAERGGTAFETRAFLSDLEAAYTALLQLESALPRPESMKRYFPPDIYWQFGPAILGGIPKTEVPDPESVLPEFRLTIKRVRIESPGFWEFVGSLNPLQQIRDYLNDRHKRRQDREFRENVESTKLRLENELIQRSIWEKENAVLRDRIAVLRDLGFTDGDIRQLIWSVAGGSLVNLGKHQDTGMIDGAE
jgi:hypothetical protein